jgi:hypothetical protein
MRLPPVTGPLQLAQPRKAAEDPLDQTPTQAADE